MKSFRRHRKPTFTVLTILLVTVVTSRKGAAADASYAVRNVTLPGSGPISMDYIAFDPATRFVWVPAGNTGAVDVIDSSDNSVRQITGFSTAEMGAGERKRVVGPSSVSIGEKSVYVGNRGDSNVCAFDPRTFARGKCHRLDSMPDGVAYVAPTREVWVTTPRDKSIRILDAATLDEKAKLTYEGNPEGFAVDTRLGRFYTNLEDKDRTLAIDLKSHQTVATWNPSCGEDGPHGLRVDAAAGRLFVACSTRVEDLDTGTGKTLSSVDTGDGVDDIDYSPASHLLYVGAARAGRLTVARVDSDGKLSVAATATVPVGARNPAVADSGSVYLAHGGGSGLHDIVLAEPKK